MSVMRELSEIYNEKKKNKVAKGEFNWDEVKGEVKYSQSVLWALKGRQTTSCIITDRNINISD